MSSLTLANIDVEKLIADIAIRPAIWDKNFNGRQNKSFLEETWNELAEIHKTSKKVLKAKWKGLRDNFRIQWKMIPRDENEQLLVAPEEFTGTKWQYYKHLLFLADNMGRSRSSYGNISNGSNGMISNSMHFDDTNFELLQRFEPAIEIPSDDDTEAIDIKPTIQHNNTSDMDDPEMEPEQDQPLQLTQNKQPPKLRAIPRFKMVDVQQLIRNEVSVNHAISMATSSSSPAPSFAINNYQQQNQHHQVASSSSTSERKRKRIADEVTTTLGCFGTATSSRISSLDEYPIASDSPRATPNIMGMTNTTRNSVSPLNTATTKDDDYHFLMSLQPYLTQFTGPQKLRMRMRIQKLIFNELYKEEDIEICKMHD